jgi:hypothetical protein
MKATIPIKTGALALGFAVLFCISTSAQEAKQADLQQLRAYDLGREVFLLGTVVKFDAASTTPPLGAHLILQTSSGQVDVHLGNGKVLKASRFELNPGDNVRIAGEILALGDGTYFAARIVQKGTQAVAVRNTKGFPVSAASAMTESQKEALRGAR